MSERRLDGFDDRLIAPGVKDARADAFMRLIARIADVGDSRDLILSLFDRVDARLLPALVRGLSCEEFVSPGMPDRIVREILKNHVRLHAEKGSDDGVKLGLSILEFRAAIEQWWATEPKGPDNTHKIDVFADHGWVGGQDVTDPALQRAARRMVRGMKRHSQDHALRFIVGSEGPIRVGSFTRHHAKLATVPFDVREVTASAGIRASAVPSASEIYRTVPLVVGDQNRTSIMRTAAAGQYVERYITRPYRRAA